MATVLLVPPLVAEDVPEQDPWDELGKLIGQENADELRRQAEDGNVTLERFHHLVELLMSKIPDPARWCGGFAARTDSTPVLWYITDQSIPFVNPTQVRILLELKAYGQPGLYMSDASTPDLLGNPEPTAWGAYFFYHNPSDPSACEA